MSREMAQRARPCGCHAHVIPGASRSWGRHPAIAPVSPRTTRELWTFQIKTTNWCEGILKTFEATKMRIGSVDFFFLGGVVCGPSVLRGVPQAVLRIMRLQGPACCSSVQSKAFSPCRTLALGTFLIWLVCYPFGHPAVEVICFGEWPQPFKLSPWYIGNCFENEP